jgi:SAM-dependent methyltransferase
MRRRRLRIALGLSAALLAIVAAALYGPSAAFHVLPLRWTGEADQLAAALRLRQGASVADIGAGTGSMSLALAAYVGPGGHIYATEIDPALRTAIARRAADNGVTNLEVVTAGEQDTGLPDQCCDAIFMRNVLHHIGDWSALARSTTSALRPGSYFAVIDFPPGTFLHLGREHGADQDAAVAAFSAADLTLIDRTDRWGGGYYMLLFRRELPDDTGGSDADRLAPADTP